MKRKIQGTLILTSFWTVLAFGQNQLNFTGVNATVEGAIQLHWASNSNEVYEIDYADALYDPDLGTANWQRLYTDYPSHGTNTFIGDFGNYDLTPPIPHPKYSGARFYRVVDLGTNNGVNPHVSLTSPANGASLSGTITVTISTTSQNDLVRRLLFVDGQEMNPSPDGTNWVINTCEWPNGPHTLFAVAKSSFGLEGTPNDTSVTYGRAVSPYVNVTFSNLITTFAFSQPYFEPALGQTQQVSAVFAANVNWTLQVLNGLGTAVRTTTGSGGTMQFGWDGRGNGGTSLPAGFYNYSLAAQTNGLPLPQIQPSTNQPPPPPPPGQSMMSSSTIDATTSTDPHPTSPKEAFSLGLDYYYPQWPPMPPVRVNGQWVPWEDVYGPVGSVKIELSDAALGTMLANSIAPQTTASLSGGVHANFAGPSSQTAVAPTRPPTIPGEGTVGTIGIGYQTYPNQFSTPPIVKTPPPITSYIALDGRPLSQASASETWGAIKENADLCNGFVKAMKNGRYAATITKTENNFTTTDLTSGTFNQVNVALVCLHCSYATNAELDGLRHIYLRFWNGNSSYVKLDQCSFGGGGTNGLKWMALLACNVLRVDNYNDLFVTQKLPINNNLHLLLGTTTLATAAPDLGKFWAQNMLASPAMTVEQAWYQAGKDAYKAETDYPTLLINFRVSGWPDAFTDKVTDIGTDPGAGQDPTLITENDVKVHPLP